MNKYFYLVIYSNLIYQFCLVYNFHFKKFVFCNG